MLDPLCRYHCWKSVTRPDPSTLQYPLALLPRISQSNEAPARLRSAALIEPELMACCNVAPGRTVISELGTLNCCDIRFLHPSPTMPITAFVSLAPIAGPLDELPVSTQAAKASGSKATNRILGVVRLCLVIIPTLFLSFFWGAF